MKFFIDLALIALFFIFYKLYDIYVAIGVTMVGYFLQFAVQTIYHRKVDKMQLAMLGFVLILGSATLLFRNPEFFKWKPTVIYILFAVVFYATQALGNKSVIQRLGEHAIILPDSAWKKLNLSWIIFFLVLAVLNITVAYLFTLDTWVHFKLFGLLGMTLLFIVGQSFYISKHMEKK